MNIIEQGKEFVQSLMQLARRSAWDWRRCPYCGDMPSCKHGTYARHPWYFWGRRVVLVQRYRCKGCRRTYSERSPFLVRGSWYARGVHRLAIDHWQHMGSSLRRTAELVRSLLGKQERWRLWHPLDEVPPEEEHCHLSASTVHRWLDRAGREAQRTVRGQLAGVQTSGQVGADGLWARLKGGTKRVVLLLVDCVTGVVWPPVVVKEEESERSWGQLFERAQKAGLDLDALRGVVSDGSHGLIGCLKRRLNWVNHQRCVWHLWRSLGPVLARRAAKTAEGLVGEAAKVARDQARQALRALVAAALDAQSQAEAGAAQANLFAHPLCEGLERMIGQQMNAALVYLREYNRGLMRVGPEWRWRDFRLRLSRGRNHRSHRRLERAALLWAVYRNFTPAQYRSERKRHYRHPGQSPLEVAGASPQGISYLDALRV